MSDSSQQQEGRWRKRGGGSLHEKLSGLPPPLLRRQTLVLQLPVFNEGCPFIVAENSKEGGSWPSVCALFMLLINWPAAVGFREIALCLKYTSSSHTAGLLFTSCRFPMASFRTNPCFILFPIIYNSTAVLLQCLCFSHVLYTVSDWIIQYPTCSLMYFQYMCTLSLRIYGGARGRNAIVNYWDLGNSFILLPRPNIFWSRTQ